MDIEQVALECARELGGDSSPIPGAKLASHIARRARAADVDFHAMLRSRGITFKAFLVKLGLKVAGYQGRDITVLLEGAKTAPTIVPPSSAAAFTSVRTRTMPLRGSSLMVIVTFRI